MTELQEFKEAQVEALQKRVKELEHQKEELEDSVTSHQQRIHELIDGNKCTKEELNMRIKELEAELKLENENKRI